MKKGRPFFYMFQYVEQMWTNYVFHASKQKQLSCSLIPIPSAAAETQLVPSCKTKKFWTLIVAPWWNCVADLDLLYLRVHLFVYSSINHMGDFESSFFFYDTRVKVVFLIGHSFRMTNLSDVYNSLRALATNTTLGCMCATLRVSAYKERIWNPSVWMKHIPGTYPTGRTLVANSSLGKTKNPYRPLQKLIVSFKTCNLLKLKVLNLI